jgi:XRE family transcriptional regulator, regulator of sulfur utilization
MSTRQSTKKKPGSEATAGLGKTIQRLRGAYKMSLGDLSEQSGVAKSIISQIEKNETNPTVGTIARLCEALDTSFEDIFRPDRDIGLIEKSGPKDTPLIMSEDGLCRLRILGWLRSIHLVQWYDLVAEPGGVLDSDPHPSGSVENLSVLSGEFEVTISESEVIRGVAGDTLRYHTDRDHKIVNVGQTKAHATMVNLILPSLLT